MLLLIHLSALSRASWKAIGNQNFRTSAIQLTSIKLPRPHDQFFFVVFFYFVLLIIHLFVRFFYQGQIIRNFLCGNEIGPGLSSLVWYHSIPVFVGVGRQGLISVNNLLFVLILRGQTHTCHTSHCEKKSHRI